MEYNMDDINVVVDYYLEEGKRKKSSKPRKTPFNKLPKDEQEALASLKKQEDLLDLSKYVKKFNIKPSNRIPKVPLSTYGVALTKKEKKKLDIQSLDQELEYWTNTSRVLLYHKKRLKVGEMSPTALRYNLKYKEAGELLWRVKNKMKDLKERIAAKK